MYQVHIFSLGGKLICLEHCVDLDSAFIFISSFCTNSDPNQYNIYILHDTASKSYIVYKLGLVVL